MLHARAFGGERCQFALARWYGAALCFLFGALGLLTLIGKAAASFLVHPRRKLRSAAACFPWYDGKR